MWLRKLSFLLLLFSIGFVPNLSALTLKEAVSDVLDSNPVVTERLHNYRATRADLGSAEAGYYPTVDIELSAGKDYRGRFTSEADETYNIFQNSLILRQNIFRGFSTHEQVNYQEMRTLAAAYSYLEKANDITLQTIKAYIDILRYKDILKNSKRHVRHIQKLYSKVKKAYKSGLTKMSEVSKVQSSLSLAKSNELVAANKLTNAIYNFRHLTGRVVSPNELKSVRFDLPLPSSQEEAALYALEYNPSVVVGKYNIKGAEALYRESKSNYLPTLDMEVKANYADTFDNTAIPYPDKSDDVKGMLVLRYNLFRGGADEADRIKKLNKISQEVAVTDELKRQVIEGLNLSWGTYELSKHQIPSLKRYRDQSAETLRLYVKEYELGERSLLDLLATENDLSRANDELINAKYNMLVAKYRILDAMGLTIASLSSDVKKYYKRVGLFTKGKVKDMGNLPISYDKDNDKVVSNKDLCPDTPNGGKGAKADGCKKRSSINILDVIKENK